MGQEGAGPGQTRAQEASRAQILKPFDIFYAHPQGWNEPHPCVIISNPVRADRRDPVEVLMCSTRRAGRPAEEAEFILDEADGLDWPTLCKCDLIYAMPRSELKNQKGTVSLARRSALVRKIIAAHNWSEILGG